MNKILDFYTYLYVRRLIKKITGKKPNIKFKDMKQWVETQK